MTKAHNFIIVASGIDTSGSNFADKFFEAGCDDATIAVQKGLLVLEFDREARSLYHAVLSAVASVLKTGAKMERLEPDYLVSASEISRRANLGRAAISLYAAGARGSNFPHPVARVTSDSPLWDWAEVAAWMRDQKKLSNFDVIQAKVMREVNRVFIEDCRPSSRLGRQLNKIKSSRELQVA
jgi:hypothetical protein